MLSFRQPPFVILTLLCFALLVTGAAGDGLNMSEAGTLRLVESDSARALLTELRSGGHSPLYYLGVAGWARLAGKSELTLRLLSGLAAILAVALAAAPGWRVGGRRERLMAAGLLGSSGWLLSAGRSIGPIGWMLALAAASALLYRRWCDQPTTERTIAFTLTLTALALTDVAGAFVLGVALAVHLLWSAATRVVKFSLIPFILAGLAGAGWLWLARAGLSIGTLFSLGSLVSLLPLVPVGLSWLLARAKGWGLAVALVVITAQLMSFRVLWPAPPNLDAIMVVLADERELLDGTVIAFPPDHPAAVALRQRGLDGGLGLNLGWRPFSEAEVRERLLALSDVPVVWALVDPTLPASAAVVSALGETRQQRFRERASALELYEFRRVAGE